MSDEILGKSDYMALPFVLKKVKVRLSGSVVATGVAAAATLVEPGPNQAGNPSKPTKRTLARDNKEPKPKKRKTRAKQSKETGASKHREVLKDDLCSHLGIPGFKSPE